MIPNPAIQKYLMLQQMQQNQQNPQEGGNPMNPLSAGSQQGIEAAQRSIQMTDSQNNRALGMAMAQFANRPAPEPGSGLAGNLGSINAAFAPAMQAYQHERANSEQMNAKMMEYQQHLEHQAAQEAAREEMQRAHLEAQERPYREMTAYQRARLEKEKGPQASQYGAGEERRKMLEEKGMLPEGATLFDEIPDKEFRKAKMKEVMEVKNWYPHASENVRSLDEMQKIIDKNPNLWKSYGRIAAAELENNPSKVRGLIANISPKDTAAYQKLEKYSADLAKNYIKIFPGRPTDLVKKTIMKSIANSSTTPGAFRAIKDKMERENLGYIRQAKQARAAWQHGYSMPFDITETEEYLENRGASEAPSQELNARAIDQRLNDLQAELESLESSPDE